MCVCVCVCVCVCLIERELVFLCIDREGKKDKERSQCVGEMYKETHRQTQRERERGKKRCLRERESKSSERETVSL